jgi:uncharacterized membrane protein YphA (DoxX/SURF4 family)
MFESNRSTALLERPVTVPVEPPAPAEEQRPSRIVTVVDSAVALNQRVAPTLLRLALAAVFVWFGALKLAGVSPVHELIAQTLPFVDADLAVLALGGVEVAIGLVLAVGILPRITLLVLAGHLAGTFLTFLTASELMWGSNFLELTADGEFVVKNVVLISAALVLIGIYSRKAAHRATA